MSRTRKDKKEEKCNHINYRSGFKKEWKRRSHKKARRTPIVVPVKTVEHKEICLQINLPQNIQGGRPLEKKVGITITIETPTIEYIEAIPKGLDIWEID